MKKVEVQLNNDYYVDVLNMIQTMPKEKQSELIDWLKKELDNKISNSQN